MHWFWGWGLALACQVEPPPNLPVTQPGTSGAGGHLGSGGEGSGVVGSAGEVSGSEGGNAGELPAEPGHGGAFEGSAGGAPPSHGGAIAEPPFDPFAGPSRCSSGKTRDPNESEAPEMNPGFACNACHAASNAASGEGDAPVFAFAGTLYRHAHEPNSCIGEGDGRAEVVATDATGAVRAALANSSGNFHSDGGALVPPFEVEVHFEGRVRRAMTAHHDPDCNGCHTEQGTRGAPGRVVLP